MNRYTRSEMLPNIQGLTTLELAQRVFDDIKKVEKMTSVRAETRILKRLANGLKSVFTTRKDEALIRATLSSMTLELIARYRGLYQELFYIGATGEEMTNSADATGALEKAIKNSHISLRDKIADMSSSEQVFCALWDSYVFHKQNIGNLKRKFMLRAFVEELSDDDAKAVLLDLAFTNHKELKDATNHRQNLANYINHEKLALAKKGCQMLHDALQQRCPNLLEQLTCSEWECSQIDNHNDPFKSYGAILFP